MYCSHCGAAVPAEHKFCASCGKPLGPLPAVLAPSRTRLENHLQLVGVLWIAYAALKLLAALAVLFAGNVILAAVRLPPEARFVPALVSTLGWGLLIVSVVGVGAGWGLLQKAPWARLLALILGFLALLNIPFGTALGVYTLWVLLPEESGREYERAAQGA
ncbi:MAG: zinc ribbon domain-containing protein [Acidobacteria bacterium]|nr:zinc ribbon domain-containing protein [Acidobacteriota bacterium]